MSRCFTYPPPGYSVSNVSTALIESIKLQKQKAIDKEQRKDRKREKKEKRNDKKDKKEKKTPNLDKPKVVQTHITEKFRTVSKAEFFSKGNKTESEQLERSSLTEEHEKPVCLLVPSTSSDSTENSNKRKRHSSPGDVVNAHGGNIIRVRLPLKKQKPSDVLPNEQQPCSTSGRTQCNSQVRNDFSSRVGTECCTTQSVSRNLDQGLVLKIDRHRISSTSKQNVRTRIPCTTDAAMTPMKKEELLYKNLTLNYVLPQLQSECLSSENNDWLFKNKNEKSIYRGERISSCLSSSWPVVTHLPEVDVFALPYTVPF